MDEELKKALLSRALGFDTEETTEERDAGNKLIKTKTVKKKVLPDLAAIKMLIELESGKGEELTLDELQKEKMRLIKELVEFEKNSNKNGQVTFFD